MTVIANYRRLRTYTCVSSERLIASLHQQLCKLRRQANLQSASLRHVQCAVRNMEPVKGFRLNYIDVSKEFMGTLGAEASMKSLLRSSEEFAQRVTKGVKTFVNFFFLKNDLRWNKK